MRDRRRAAGARRRPLRRAGRRRHDPHRPAPLRGHRRPRVRGQLRRGRLPRHDRPRRPRRTTSTAPSRASSRRSSCRRSPSAARRARGPRSTTSPCTARPATGSPTSPTRSAGEEIGRVRCDGLVVATPQGSTGYNLANGGPILAWGVKGYVVSFIAPHSLTARALVVAPDDPLTINNASREEPVEVHVDGRPTCELPPGEDLHVEFAKSARHARAAAGRELLPPAAREVRAARALNCSGFVPKLLVRRGSVGSRWYTLRRAPRTPRREPAADRAGRAAARPGPERADGGDRRGQDGARPRARPAARRQAALGDRAARGVGGVRRGRVRPARGAARRAGRSPARGRRRARAGAPGQCRGAHARLPRRPQRHGGRPAARSAASCCRSTASTSTGG